MTEFRLALERGDLAWLRRHWAETCPAMPQPESEEAAEIVMHYARTQAESIQFRSRAWSHCWLVERGLPSGLPEHLKPRAERVEAIAVEAVGIAVMASNPMLQPVADDVRRAMEAEVEDAYAHRRTDPAFVRARMVEARERTLKGLLGGVPRGR